MNIAIIGGGIIGSTAAFYTQKQGVNVTLFDDENGQASKAAAGIISPWLSQRRNKDWYQLASRGAAFYPGFINDLSQFGAETGYQKVGTLLFKKSPELTDKLYHLAKERKKTTPEIGDITLVSPTELKQIIPPIETDATALYISGGARLDGHQLITSLHRSFCQKGGTFLPEHVQRLKALDNRWVVETTNSSTIFDKVLLTVGPWLPSLLTPLGYQVDIHPQKGQLAELSVPFRTDDWPVIMPPGEGDIIPIINGRLLVGATHENQQRFNLTPDESIVKSLIANHRSLFPAIETYPLKNIQVGTRAYTSDFLPFFGAVPDSDNLYAASGLGSSGLTTGPYIGYLLSQLFLNKINLESPESFHPNNYIQKNS